MHKGTELGVVAMCAEEDDEIFLIVQGFELTEALSRSSCKWRRGGETKLWLASSRVSHDVYKRFACCRKRVFEMLVMQSGVRCAAFA